MPDDDDYRFDERVRKLVKHEPVEIKDDGGLESEADAMGARAMKHKSVPKKGDE